MLIRIEHIKFTKNIIKTIADFLSIDVVGKSEGLMQHLKFNFRDPSVYDVFTASRASGNAFFDAFSVKNGVYTEGSFKTISDKR